MGLLQRLFGIKNATMKEPEWWRQAVSMSPVASGAVVTTNTAMQVSAVWACVRIIAESISSLPVKIYRRNGTDKVHVPDHPLQFLLSGLSNDNQTSLDMLQFLMSNVLLRGTGYALVAYGPRGVRSIEPLYSSYMHVDRTEDGSLVYDYQEPGRPSVYGVNEIWRVTALGSNGITGISPISLGRESIGVAISAEEQAARLYSNGMQVPVAFEKDGVLGDAAYERLKQSLNENYAGSRNAYKSIILEDGLKLKQVGLTAEDSQFLESRKFQISEIARWYRVPLHMLNELDRATFSNIEHQSIEFVTHTLRPWIRQLELSILRDLFSENERKHYYAEFKIDGLLRGDIKTRYDAYGKGIIDGWLSRNEVRGFENLNRVDGLDEYLVPMNMGSTDTEAMGLISGEVKAVLHEHAARKGADFGKWVNDYYPRLADKLVSCGYPPGAVSPYCAGHAAQLKAPGVDVKALTDRWMKTAKLELCHA
jgi:HK97 family phage portal protein